MLPDIFDAPHSDTSLQPMQPRTARTRRPTHRTHSRWSAATVVPANTGTLLVTASGGVPPYTWSAAHGSVTSLSVSSAMYRSPMIPPSANTDTVTVTDATQTSQHASLVLVSTVTRLLSYTGISYGMIFDGTYLYFDIGQVGMGTAPGCAVGRLDSAGNFVYCAKTRTSCYGPDDIAWDGVNIYVTDAASGGGSIQICRISASECSASQTFAGALDLTASHVLLSAPNSIPTRATASGLVGYPGHLFFVSSGDNSIYPINNMTGAVGTRYTGLASEPFSGVPNTDLTQLYVSS